MNDAVDVIISLFNVLTNTSLLGLPLIAWALIPAVVGIVFSFVKKRDSNERS